MDRILPVRAAGVEVAVRQRELSGGNSPAVPAFF